MKDNIEYFGHDTDAADHPKMKALMATFGFEGYGRFWRLNELIGAASGCKLDVSRKLYFNSVADELRLSPDELQSFVDFLTDEDECGLLKVVDNCLVTDRTQDNLQQRMTAREAASERRRRRIKNVADESQSSCDAEHKGKGEGKGKVSKQEQEERSALFDFVVQEKSSLANPTAFARKVVADPGRYPDIVERFQQARASPSAPPQPGPPAPQTCDTCGSSAFRETTGVRECRVCGRHFELTAGEWRADPETGRSPPSAFEDDQDNDFEDDEHDEPGVASG